MFLISYDSNVKLTSGQLFNTAITDSQGFLGSLFNAFTCCFVIKVMNSCPVSTTACAAGP